MVPDFFDTLWMKVSVEKYTSLIIVILQENLSRPFYLPKTATEQLKEIFEKQQNNVSLDEKQAEWWKVPRIVIGNVVSIFVLHVYQ